MAAQFLTHFFASFTDSFILLFSKLLKLWSSMLTRQTQSGFPDPKSYRDFRETGAWDRFSKCPLTIPALRQILKSKPVE